MQWKIKIILLDLTLTQLPISSIFQKLDFNTQNLSFSVLVDGKLTVLDT